MLVFRKIWPAFFSCYLRFEIRLFALLPMNTNGTGIRILDRFNISLSTHQTHISPNTFYHISPNTHTFSPNTFYSISVTRR